MAFHNLLPFFLTYRKSGVIFVFQAISVSLYMDFQELPKIELHLHLDCSLSFDVVNKLDPTVDRARFDREYVAGGQCKDLRDYLDRAVKGYSLMQDEMSLRAVTYDLFDQLQRDSVIYAEIRYAPLQHLAGGLKPQEVVEIVNGALVECTGRTGIEVRMILCTLRHFSAEQSMITVQLVDEFYGTTVVGFDLAADEAGFPIDNHLEAFRYARLRGIPCTAHAGEACGPSGVWETLRHFKPSRIGHGVRSIEDPILLDYLRDHGIHLEVCPTSNIQTHTYETYSDHPVSSIFDHGISVSISTDGRTISDISLTEEYKKLHEFFNWEPRHFLQCNRNALQAAFLSDEEKPQILQRLIQAYS